jgi:hypothetical protein
VVQGLLGPRPSAALALCRTADRPLEDFSIELRMGCEFTFIS